MTLQERRTHESIDMGAGHHHPHRVALEALMNPVRQEQQWLRQVGWPIAVDGQAGPRTRQARRDFRAAQGFLVRTNWRAYRKRLEWSARNGGRFAPAAHFYYSDWKSNGNGWIKVKRSIWKLAERVRKRAGPFGVLSGYRDPVWNWKVGGSSRSYHLLAQAVDPSKRLPLWAATDAGAGGTGICSGSSTTCCHFDTGPKRQWRY